MAKRKKKSGGKWLLLFLSVILLGFGIFYMIGEYTKPPRYHAFGISLPSGFSIHGIDVSHHQSRIDWEDVSSMNSGGKRIGFAFMKATEGTGNVDRHFKRNWACAGTCEMPRGAYHFFLANRDSKLQAENFIRTVQLSKGDLPPVLDVENTLRQPASRIRSGVQDWLKRVEKRFGVKPIIYTNVDFYETYLEGYFDDYPLWVAHYLKSDRPRISRPWQFWQHSERGRVNGVRERVDFNVFNGDSSDFASILIP